MNIDIVAKNNNRDNTEDIKLKAPKRINWDTHVESNFISVLNKTDMLSKINGIAVANITSNNEIEDSVNCLTDTLTNAVNIKPLARKLTRKSIRKARNKNKPWFDEHLVALKKELNRLGNEYVKSHKNEILRQRFFK